MATRWSPDTCKCVLEYDGIAEDGTYINPVIVNLCQDHHALNLPSAQAHFDRTKDDNQFKNQSITALAELGHAPEEIDFAYDKEFNLTLKLPQRVNAQARQTAQSHAKGKFQKAKADRLKVE